MTLITAIQENNEEEFFRLLNLKTDSLGKKFIDELDEVNGGNPLHVAVSYGHLRFIAPLIKAGINVNQVDNDGWTPVYIAADNGHENIIAALKAGGADVDSPNGDGLTPVHVAVENGRAVAVIALKKAGANMDSPNSDGFTPICIAAQMGEVAIITTLLESGANASIKTPEGTPLEQAKKSTKPGCPGVVRLLEAHLKQYPNGIKTQIATNKESSLPVKLEQKNPPVFVHFANDSFSKRRGSGKLTLTDKKDEQEKVQYVLEELRTFFIEERYIGEKTENYAIYNEYLKKANNSAQLAYKPTQGKHVLYINGKPEEDADIAAQEISKLIDILSSAKVPQKILASSAVQPLTAVVNANSIQATPQAVSPAAPPALKVTSPDQRSVLEPTMLSQFPAFIKPTPVAVSASKDSSCQVSASDLSAFLREEKARVEPQSMLAQFNQVIKPIPRVNASGLKTFLRLVAEGEQSEAEKMLMDNHDLASMPGDVTDLSKRTFTGITAFQYAVWALDWHMWSMIRKYLYPEEVQRQAQGFETGGWVAQHGVHADLNTLLQAYQTTEDLYSASKYDESDTAWVQQVGGAQLLLPAHAINEYCHPSRPFHPLPNFKDTAALPRSRVLHAGEWFTVKYNQGTLGNKFAAARGDARGRGGALMYLPGKWEASHLLVRARDAMALGALSSARIGQREELIAGLKPRSAQENSA